MFAISDSETTESYNSSSTGKISSLSTDETNSTTDDKSSSSTEEENPPTTKGKNPSLSELPKLELEEVEEHIKIVVMGNQGIGKTSLILRALKIGLPLPGEIHVTKAHLMEVEINKERTTCMVWDTNACVWKENGKNEDENQEKKRQYYENVSLILLCYAVDNVDSFQAVADVWMEDITEMKIQAHIFLVGLRSELRSNFFSPALSCRTNPDISKLVSKQSIEKMKKKFSFKSCFECSIYLPNTVDDIFVEAINVAKKKKTNAEHEIDESADVSMGSPEPPIKGNPPLTEGNPPPTELPRLKPEKVEDHIKIVVMGNQGIGKTSLILSALKIGLPLPGEIHVTMAHPMVVEINKEMTSCMVWDTNACVLKGKNEDGNQEKKRHYYENASLILLCYAVDMVKSVKDVADFWMDDIKEMAVRKPIFLVGLRSELRSHFFSPALSCRKNPDISKLVSKQSIEKMKKQFSFESCFECSIYLPNTVDDIFVEAINKLRSPEHESVQNMSQHESVQNMSQHESVQNMSQHESVQNMSEHASDTDVTMQSPEN